MKGTRSAESGQLSNWDVVEEMWKHALGDKCLRVDPKAGMNSGACTGDWMG